jgi:hypothetical protein
MPKYRAIYEYDEPTTSWYYFVMPDLGTESEDIDPRTLVDLDEEVYERWQAMETERQEVYGIIDQAKLDAMNERWKNGWHNTPEGHRWVSEWTKKPDPLANMTDDYLLFLSDDVAQQ